MQAIPTEYRGVQLRSRFEADMAYLLDALQEPENQAFPSWVFEPKSFMLSDGTHYRPDFFVPTMNLWVECRGYRNDKGDRQIEQFARDIGSGLRDGAYLVVRDFGSVLYGRGGETVAPLTICPFCRSWTMAVPERFDDHGPLIQACALKGCAHALPEATDLPGIGLRYHGGHLELHGAVPKIYRDEWLGIMGPGIDFVCLDDWQPVREWLIDYRSMNKMPVATHISVYLAGKISSTDWRHEIVPGLRDASYGDGGGFVENFAYEECRISPEFIYAGPYFISCDHGCCHGRNQHGVGATSDCYGNAGGTVPKLRVAATCLEWIDRSNVMFVWLDSRDAFGTLVEMGYAKARDIPIWLYEPTTDIDDLKREIDEMEQLEEAFDDADREQFSELVDKARAHHDIWFARAMASEHKTVANVREAWEDFGKRAPFALSADRWMVRG